MDSLGPTRKPLPPVHGYHPLHQGPTITKEEVFGLALHDTIKTIGGIMGIDQQRAAAIHKGEGHKLQALLERRKALQITLAAQLPALNDGEMSQLLSRYPWVVQA